MLLLFHKILVVGTLKLINSYFLSILYNTHTTYKIVLITLRANKKEILLYVIL